MTGRGDHDLDPNFSVFSWLRSMRAPEAIGSVCWPKAPALKWIDVLRHLPSFGSQQLAAGLASRPCQQRLEPDLTSL